MIDARLRLVGFAGAGRWIRQYSLRPLFAKLDVAAIAGKAPC
jgi:hypothetical protein